MATKCKMCILNWILYWRRKIARRDIFGIIDVVEIWTAE